MGTPDSPTDGAQILAKIPDDLKDGVFFADYQGDFYPAQVLGTDTEEAKMAIKFADGGPFVGLGANSIFFFFEFIADVGHDSKYLIRPLFNIDPGIDMTKRGDEFVALPKVGDKVTLAQSYWDSCCAEEYDPAKDGPLRLGDVGEVVVCVCVCMRGRCVCVCVCMRGRGVCVCVCVCEDVSCTPSNSLYMCIIEYPPPQPLPLVLPCGCTTFVTTHSHRHTHTHTHTHVHINIHVHAHTHTHTHAHTHTHKYTHG